MGLKFVFAIVALSIILAGPVLAVATPITINTAPDTYVIVRVWKAGDKIGLLQSFIDLPSGLEGKVETSYDSTESEIDVEVFIKLQKDSPASFYVRKGPFVAGSPISIDLPEKSDGEVVGEVPAVVNSQVQVNNQTNSTSNETGNVSVAALTGQVVSGEQSSFAGSGLAWIFVLAVVAIGAAGFFGYQRHQRLHGLGAVDPPEPLNQIKATSLASSGPSEIESMRRELAMAKRELQSLKNKDKIKQVEEQIKRESDELRKLKGEF